MAPLCEPETGESTTETPRHGLRGRFVVVIALVLAAAACGKSNSTTSPSTTPKTETFMGTVNVGQSDSHPFTVTQSGEVDVTLTAAGPPSTISMGIGVGTVNGATCALLAGASTTTQAGTSVQLAGTVTAGSFCVEVYDAGNQTAPVTYSVTVTHPN